jgi:hypothetical protein
MMAACLKVLGPSIRSKILTVRTKIWVSNQLQKGYFQYKCMCQSLVSNKQKCCIPIEPYWTMASDSLAGTGCSSMSLNANRITGLHGPCMDSVVCILVDSDVAYHWWLIYEKAAEVCPENQLYSSSCFSQHWFPDLTEDTLRCYKKLQVRNLPSKMLVYVQFNIRLKVGMKFKSSLFFIQISG